MDQEIIQFLENQHSVSIKHNDFKTYYEKIEDYIETSIDEDYRKEYSDVLNKCIESNSLWELRCYPKTAVGFYEIFSDTFEGLIEILKKEID